MFLRVLSGYSDCRTGMYGKGATEHGGELAPVTEIANVLNRTLRNIGSRSPNGSG